MHPGKMELSVSRAALLDKGSDQAFRQLVQDLLGVAMRLQTVQERLGALAGVTGAQYSLLAAAAHLATLGTPATVTRIAAHLHVSSTFVTAESGKLIAAGLVGKRPNPSDRRSVFLQLTPKGDRALRDMMGALRAINDEIFRELNRADFVALCRIVAAMVPALDDALALYVIRKGAAA